jgi:hypothetical protein
MEISAQDLKHADRRVSQLGIKVYLRGVKRSPAGHPDLIYDKLDAETKGVCSKQREPQLEQMYGGSDPCSGLQLQLGNWLNSFDLLNHLDPDSHLVIHITVELRSFRALVSTFDCKGLEQYRFRCAASYFTSTHDSPQVSRSGIRETDEEDTGFFFDIASDDNPFEKQIFLGRDTDLDYLHVQYCDIHDPNETEQDKRHRLALLARIKADQPWEVDVIPSEGSKSPFDLEKRYPLRLTERFQIGSEVCRDFRYRPY